MSKLLSDKQLVSLKDIADDFDNQAVLNLLDHIDALSTSHATALREAEIAAVRRGAELFVICTATATNLSIDKRVLDNVVASYKREKNYE